MKKYKIVTFLEEIKLVQKSNDLMELITIITRLQWVSCLVGILSEVNKKVYFHIIYIDYEVNLIWLIPKQHLKSYPR